MITEQEQAYRGQKTQQNVRRSAEKQRGRMMRWYLQKPDSGV